MPRGVPRTIQTNVVTHAGSRAPERRAVQPSNRRPMKSQYENNPKFPGFRTVIVPRENPNPHEHDLIGQYLAGDPDQFLCKYTLASEDVSDTMHPGNVLLKVPIEEFERMEDLRANGPEGHNTALNQPTVMGPDGLRRYSDMATRDNRSTTKIFFDEEGSGATFHEPVTPDEAAAGLPNGPLTRNDLVGRKADDDDDE